MKTIYLASGILLAGVVGSVYRPGTTAPFTQVDRRASAAKHADLASYGWHEALCALSEKPSKDSSDCSPADVAGQSRTLTVAIAFVPDPYMTRLRLQFDRSIEALTWAAQDSGFFSFRSHWLPWQVHDQEYSRLPDEQKSDAEEAERRKQPGVLVFSGAHRGLAVFLVGESPTHAFDPHQLKTAVEAAETWGGQGTTQIPVIGPCFSGTLGPLADALEGEWKDTPFEIWSGTANSTVAEREFAAQVSTHKGSQFHSLLHNEVLRLLALRDYLQTGIEVQDSRVTMLSEDETTFAYQTVTSKEDESPESQSGANFRFPRGIAYLRNAYQNSPGMLSLSVQDSTTPRRSLELSLEAPKEEHDSIPEFSAQTPVSAEAQLRLISEHLNAGRVRLAEVVATDVLDTLFVAKFLKLSAPNTRQIFLDSDLLLGRAGDYPSLLGSLEVASYPPMTARSLWLPDRADVSSSSSEFEEGIYRAARASLQGAPALRPLGETAVDPPLWLTVLGESQPWPLAILNDPPHTAPHDPYLPSSGADQATLNVPPLARIWKSLFFLGLLLSFGYIVAFAYGQWVHGQLPGAAPGAPPRYDLPWTDLWLKPEEPAPYARAFYILCLTLSLAAAWWALTSGIRGYRQEGHVLFQILWACTAIPMLLLVASAVWLSYRTLTLQPGEAPRINVARRWQYQALLAVPWLLFGFFLFDQGRLLGVRAYFKSFFYSYRSIELGSGVSPVLPLLFLFLAFVCWSIVHLQRRVFAEERYQLLPRNLSSRQIAAPVEELARQIEENLECTFPRPYLGTILASLLFLRSAYWMARHHFQSLEGPAYDVYFSVAVATLVTLLFLSTWRFWYCWRQLLTLLEQLALHPIRWALRDLPVEYSWSPIWQGSPRKRVYAQLTRAVDCLRQTRRLQKRDATDTEKAVEGAAAALLQCVAARKRVDPKLYQSLQLSLLALTETAVNELNGSAWAEGSSETLLKAEDEDKKRTLLLPGGGSPEETCVTLAKEFVALRFVSFIRYVMLQLRNLLTFVMLGFVLLALSLGCYPFSSPSLLAWTLVGCMVLTGIPIVLAFLEMGRDATLSWISDTKAGEVDKISFLTRVTAFGILPLLSVVAAHFPSIGQYVFSWVQPMMKAIH